MESRARSRSRSPRSRPQIEHQNNFVDDGIDVKVVSAVSGEEVCVVTAQPSWTERHLARAVFDARHDIPMHQQRFLISDGGALNKYQLLGDLQRSDDVLWISLVRLNVEGGWMRLESRRRPGEFFYYNTATCETSVDPPPPWQKRESRSYPGAYYFWNQETGEVTPLKPEV